MNTHLKTKLIADINALDGTESLDALLVLAKTCQPWLSEFTTQELAPLANAVNTYLATASSSASGEDLLVASKILEATELKPTSPTVAEQLEGWTKRIVHSGNCLSGNKNAMSDTNEFSETATGRGAYAYGWADGLKKTICDVSGRGAFFGALTHGVADRPINYMRLWITIDGAEFFYEYTGKTKNYERLYVGMLGPEYYGHYRFSRPFDPALGIPFKASLKVEAQVGTHKDNHYELRRAYAYYVLNQF